MEDDDDIVITEAEPPNTTVSEDPDLVQRSKKKVKRRRNIGEFVEIEMVNEEKEQAYAVNKAEIGFSGGTPGGESFKEGLTREGTEIWGC
ncbi:hypothetical protein U1Q18_026779 [Sarracenia purpurea var. burkii]